MRKKTLVIIALVIVGILAIHYGYLRVVNAGFCTEIACGCFDGSEDGFTGERSCNTCQAVDSMIVTGVFNVVTSCRAQEVILCEDGSSVNTRYDLTDECVTRSYVSFFEVGS